MGRQQSFIKFKSTDVLKNELIKYQERDIKEDMATVYGVVEVIKSVTPFKKGELAVVVGGERYAQRNAKTVEEELGIGNVQKVVFIDNYYPMAEAKSIDLGDLLDAHFRTLDENELKSFGLVN